MIIDKNEFKNYTAEQIKECCNKYNKENGNTFGIKDNKFCIGEGVRIPLGMFDYKKDICRTMLMTSEEFEQEVRAGNIEGCTISDDGLIGF